MSGRENKLFKIFGRIFFYSICSGILLALVLVYLFFYKRKLFFEYLGIVIFFSLYIILFSIISGIMAQKIREYGSLSDFLKNDFEKNNRIFMGAYNIIRKLK